MKTRERCGLFHHVRFASSYSTRLPILFLLAISLVIGLFTVHHYGESWDELKFYKYADKSLTAYSTWLKQGEITPFGNTYDNFGSAYVMLVTLGSRLLGHVLPWVNSDLRHFIYFLTFLACIFAFYTLCLRWLTRPAAFGAAFLFASQPLFWGHAFINPKDIPFLTFFLISLVLGLRMVDSYEPLSLASLPSRRKIILLATTAFWFASLITLFACVGLVYAWLDSLVRAAALGDTSLLPSLIIHLASDLHKVEPHIYTQKLFVIFLRLRLLYTIVSFVVLGLIYFRNIPSFFRCVKWILPAAIFLGITTSIRVLGPLAGLIVTAYACWKFKQKAISALLIYGFFFIIAMYLTWPYLWPDPIGRFIESVQVMSRYPWAGKVLFNRMEYTSTNLPVSYLPVLLGIQMSEPVWVLFISGLAITIASVVKKRVESRQLLALTLLWFILPLVGFILSRSPLYDNFRQIFFILPPVFILVGVVIDRIKRPLLQTMLIVLAVLPGIWDGIHLHPYEYIYYNRFVGGVHGAFRRFELDYWGTSYREAAGYLNQIAPQASNIWVEGPAHLLELYARQDLRIFSNYEVARSDHYDYIVATSRYNLDLSAYPDAKIIYSVERNGAILTVIKAPLSEFVRQHSYTRTECQESVYRGQLFPVRFYICDLLGNRPAWTAISPQPRFFLLPVSFYLTNPPKYRITRVPQAGCPEVPPWSALELFLTGRDRHKPG